MRGDGCELRSRKRGGGKQHKAKVCHDDESPWKNPEQQTRCLLTERIGAGDQQTIVRPDCGGLQMRNLFYFGGAST
jgi:hypothetical protein